MCIYCLSFSLSPIHHSIQQKTFRVSVSVTVIPSVILFDLPCFFGEKFLPISTLLLSNVTATIFLQEHIYLVPGFIIPSYGLWPYEQSQLILWPMNKALTAATGSIDSQSPDPNKTNQKPSLKFSNWSCKSKGFFSLKSWTWLSMHTRKK